MNQKKTKTLLLLVILVVSLILLYRWSSPVNDVTKMKLEENGYKFKILSKSEYGIIYNAVKDYGAPTNTVRKIIVEKDNKYYEIKKRGKINILNDTLILNSVSHVTEPNTHGNWILMDRYTTTENNHAVRFFYDTIPADYPIAYSDDLKEGLYKFENNELKFIGKLTDYKSMHDLKQSGYYYLTSPGIFYNWKINIKNLK